MRQLLENQYIHLDLNESPKSEHDSLLMQSGRDDNEWDGQFVLIIWEPWWRVENQEQLLCRDCVSSPDECFGCLI